MLNTLCQLVPVEEMKGGRNYRMWSPPEPAKMLGRLQSKRSEAGRRRALAVRLRHAFGAYGMGFLCNTTPVTGFKRSPTITTVGRGRENSVWRSKGIFEGGERWSATSTLRCHAAGWRQHRRCLLLHAMIDCDDASRGSGQGCRMHEMSYSYWYVSGPRPAPLALVARCLDLAGCRTTPAPTQEPRSMLAAMARKARGLAASPAVLRAAAAERLGGTDTGVLVSMPATSS